ncbi:hypothetical protein HZF02_23280 [Pseudomonas yamanorum]|nr:hypothetical protein HZF02_23280 [Pseudomonas yamanorum]
MFRKLLSGRFSLVVTFWVWGIGCGLILGGIGLISILKGVVYVFLVAKMLQVVLFVMVIIGIVNILRRDVTFWGVFALLVVLVNLLSVVPALAALGGVESD